MKKKKKKNLILDEEKLSLKPKVIFNKRIEIYKIKQKYRGAVVIYRKGNGKVQKKNYFFI